MPIATRTFRVFVSSTFEDLKAERNALAAPGGPFAELTKLCQSFGARFQAIDLRWGVREEAGHDQRTMEICLGEIERCQRTGIKPNFIVLLGDRYGWRPLPARIEAEEFHAVRENIAATQNRELVDAWYQLDANSVPPEYLLKPRTGKFIDRDTWVRVEAQMHNAMRKAARAAGLSRDALIKYEASATHQEILKGLGKTLEDHAHVFAFFRTPKEPREDPVLSDLKQFLRDELKGNLFEPRDTSELCERVRENLERVIRAEAERFKSRPALDLEVGAHAAFARERARHFMGREDVLGSIAEYIKGVDRRPMVVRGASGSGKSAVMARASEAVLDNPGNEVVIRRFIGATPESSSGITLLRSVCEQIGQQYGVTEEIPVEFNSVVRTFTDRLALATSVRPLVLFIDALDQIAPSDLAAAVTWLRPELPTHCRIVVSTTDAARSLEGAPVLELKALPVGHAEEALALWLNDAKRKLQGQQHEKLLLYFNRCSLPLYLKLAFEEARRWRSFDEVEVCVLGEGLAGIIDVMFERLSSGADHGQVLVSRGLGYLVAARYGLTEDEMLEVLTLDKEVWNEFDAAKRHEPPERRLPVIVWSRLYLDLAPYFTERAVPGGTTISFYHRQLSERVATNTSHHAELARYFSRQPTWRGQQKANERKLTELVRQQTSAGFLDDAVTSITDLDFISATCAADLLLDLQEEYREAVAGLPESKARLQENAGRETKLVLWAKTLSNCTEEKRLPGPEEIIQSVELRTNEQISAEPKRILHQTTRSERLLIFATFVAQESHRLLEFGKRPEFVSQHAFNVAPRGPIRDSASHHLEALMVPSIVRRWSPSSVYDPKPAILRTLQGHTSRILSLCVASDGRRAISGSEDKTVRLWDLESGACLHVFDGHSGSVNMTPDGRYAMFEGGGQLHFWNLETRECVRITKIAGQLASITPDGRRAVTALDGGVGRLAVWDIDAGQCTRTLEKEDPFLQFCCVAMTPNGEIAVSGSGDGTLRLWDLESGRCLWATPRYTKYDLMTAGGRGIGIRLDQPQSPTLLAGHTDRVVAIESLQTGG